MKFSKGDVVRRVLPSGTMVGGLMVVINNIGDKRTAVRAVSYTHLNQRSFIFRVSYSIWTLYNISDKSC